MIVKAEGPIIKTDPGLVRLTQVRWNILPGNLVHYRISGQCINYGVQAVPYLICGFHAGGKLYYSRIVWDRGQKKLQVEFGDGDTWDTTGFERPELLPVQFNLGLVLDVAKRRIHRATTYSKYFTVDKPLSEAPAEQHFDCVTAAIFYVVKPVDEEINFNKLSCEISEYHAFELRAKM